MIFFTSNPNLNNNKEPEKSDTKNVSNIDHLNMLIRAENWDLTLQNMDIDKTYATFSNKMQQLIIASTNNIIVGSRMYKKKKLKEWIPQGLIVSIGKRNALSKKLRFRLFDRELKLNYTRYWNLLNTLIKKAKILYYQKKMKSAGADSKSMWKIINNEVLGKKNNKIDVKCVFDNNTLIENEKNICDVFNTFFVNIGADIENNIKSNGFVDNEVKHMTLIDID